MDSDSEITEGLLEIDSAIQRMLRGESSAYDAGWLVWQKAMALATVSPHVMHPLWLIWGALTDWVENRPEEIPEAEAKMRQAGEEWLALNRADPACVKAYMDRWVYEELGYERRDR